MGGHLRLRESGRLSPSMSRHGGGTSEGGARGTGGCCVSVHLKPFYPLPEADWVIDHVLPNQPPTVTCAIETEAHFCHGWHGEVSDAFGIRRQGAASTY